MEEKKVHICRLCLNVVSDNNYEALKETHTIQIQYILPDLNLLVSNNPVLCAPCTDALQESYEFKTACVEVETYLENFIMPLRKVDLKEVVASKMFSGEVKKEITDFNEGKLICRLCLGFIEDKLFKEFGVIEENILQKCVPEVDLTVTENPVSCENCMGYLHSQFNFMMRCLDADETINGYITSQGLTVSDKLNLHEVVQFSVQNNQMNESTDCESDLIELENKNFVPLNDSFGMDVDDVAHMALDPLLDGIRELSDVGLDISCNKPSVDARGRPIVWHKCEVCPYSTFRKYSLRIHMLIHKKPEEYTMYKCTICPHETNRKSNLLIHLLKHKGPGEVTMHQCKECTYETRLRSNLLKHLLVHKTPDEVKMHQCPNCPYKSKLKGNLLIHMIQHKKPEELVMHKCGECSYQTKLKNNLRKHILTHRGPIENAPVYKCKECNYQSRWKSHLLRHMVLHNSVEVTLHKCEHCPYVANHKDNLRKHLLTHKDPSEVKMHKCDLCDFQSKRKDKIKQHMYNMHKCTACDFETKEKEELTSHLKTHVLPEQSFKCDVCNYEARQKRYLQRHKKIHLVENPDQIVWHKCELCPYQAKRKDVLNNHLLIHKDPSQVEMHHCPTCTYQTKRKHNLVIHQKSHCKGDLGKKRCKEEPVN
ncbi:zinc finger protein 99-like [Anoplophora glabripennis]|uniref:zinc finger protein 99-like n=1 Tax=Anoplophora glabripennis TaxID=217634 RepID=UPI0008741239|nr:zinc finger protein 99-like [Anoplophora glabripennis]